jgi:hypothetical protein
MIKRETKKRKEKPTNVCNIKQNERRRKNKKGSTNTYASVWLIEEDLRARLPVLFEGTKYEESAQERERATTPES